MKKILIGLLFVSTQAYATTTLETFSQAKEALLEGAKISMVMDFKKCQNSTYTTQASFIPDAFQITDQALITSGMAITNLDPDSVGMLSREVINYVIVPYHGIDNDNNRCQSLSGCTLISSSVYRMDNSTLIKTYPPMICPINTGIKFYRL